jgi:hypothetical protein
VQSVVYQIDLFKKASSFQFPASSVTLKAGRLYRHPFRRSIERADGGWQLVAYL